MHRNLSVHRGAVHVTLLPSKVLEAMLKIVRHKFKIKVQLHYCSAAADSGGTLAIDGIGPTGVDRGARGGGFGTIL